MGELIVIDDRRNYGIDILRHLSMFMVVMLHVLGHGGILYNISNTSFKGIVVWFIYLSSYCAVNVFALISGYLGVNSRHKSRNIINLSFQVIFYCLIFTLAYFITSIANGVKIGFGNTLRNLFPSVFYTSMFGNYWYFAAYFCLFPLMPLLNKILELPKQYLKKVMLFAFIVFICIYQFSKNYINIVAFNSGYSILWLAFLYLVGGYFAKYKTLEKIRGWGCFVGFVVCVSLTLINLLLSDKITELLGTEKFSMVLFSYTSPTTFLSAVFLLGLFSKIKINSIKVKKILKVIHPAAFGVYLIHSHIFVWKYLKPGITPVVNYSGWTLVPAVFAICLTIYIACLLIDLLRIKLFKITKVNTLSVKIEEKIEKMFSSSEKEEIKEENSETNS